MEIHLFFACFIMFGLHMVVLLLLFINRVNNVRAGITDPKYFKTYDIQAQIPRFTKQLARNYSNQFEAPTLFYAVIAMVLAMGLSHIHLVILAYAYVGMRVLHSLTHITSNKIYPRMVLFLLSAFTLTLLWLKAFLAALEKFSF